MNLARELLVVAHANQRARTLAVARQIRVETNQAPDHRLDGVLVLTSADRA